MRKTAETERIAKEVAMMGRYPSKRPAGLQVDRKGAFLLEDLMRTWGHSAGLHEWQVLDAVRRHMFSDGPGGRSLRFAINSEAAGITIRVNPKSGGSGGAAEDRPPSPRLPARMAPLVECVPASRPEAIPARSTPKASSSVPPLHVRALRGSVAETMGVLAFREEEAERDQLPRRPLSPPAAPMDDEDTDGAFLRRARVRRACEQMGLTPETQHVRLTPRSSRREDSRRPLPERVSRWLSWALKAGHRELQLRVDHNGFVALDELVEAMREDRGASFGQRFDVQSLAQLLASSDHEGRFEVSQGKVRKVDKELRRPRTMSVSPSPSPSRGAAASAVEERKMPALPERRKPAMPPGEGWMKFQDNGTDWYYYEGPLGKWWVLEGSDEIMPFTD